MQPVPTNDSRLDMLLVTRDVEKLEWDVAVGVIEKYCKMGIGILLVDDYHISLVLHNFLCFLLSNTCLSCKKKVVFPYPVFHYSLLYRSTTRTSYNTNIFYTH